MGCQISLSLSVVETISDISHVSFRSFGQPGSPSTRQSRSKASDMLIQIKLEQLWNKNCVSPEAHEALVRSTGSGVQLLTWPVCTSSKLSAYDIMKVPRHISMGWWSTLEHI